MGELRGVPRGERPPAAAHTPQPLGQSLDAASPRTRLAVTAVQVAGLAAEAIRTVPGVAALQPRLHQLPWHWTQRVWTQATGRPLPDTAGVGVRMHDSTHPHGPGVEVEACVVLDGHLQAAAVAAAAQLAVADAVRQATALRVHRVEVYVCEILTATATRPSEDDGPSDRRANAS